MITNTLLLIGGDLCVRTARELNASTWRCVGLRRRQMPDTCGPLRWVQGDLTDCSSLATALATAPDISHILYAPAPEARTREAYAAAYPQGLQTLLAALPAPRHLQRLVLVDSTAMWGSSASWVDERTPPHPEDFRGEFMLKAEATAQAQLPGARFPQASGVALRLSGLYGPGRLRLVDSLRAGRLSAPGGPDHWANRIHVDDAARACVHLLQLNQPDACYIGTDDTPLETATLYDAFAALVQAPRPDRRSQPPNGKRLSNQRLRQSGWAPQWPDTIVGYTHCIAESEAAKHPV